MEMTLDQKRAIAMAKARMRLTEQSVERQNSQIPKIDINQILQTSTDQSRELLSNTPGSALNFAKNIYTAVRHPIETFTTLKDLATGLIHKTTPGVQPDEKLVDATVSFFKDRYGGAEEIKNTILKDPVGFAADLSFVLNTVGGAANLAGKVSKLKSITSVGEKITKAGNAVNPITLAQKANPLRLFPKGTETKMYQSAVKMPQKLKGKKLTPIDRERIAQTGLDNGIVPNANGYVKLLDKIDDANKKIANSIKGAKGKYVETDKITSTLDDLKDFYKNTIDPKPFLDEIDNIVTGMKDTWGERIPIEQAQKIKQNTYVMLRKHYGELKGLSIEAQKALARGIKDQIVANHPEIKSLNKADSALLELEDVIEKAASRISNRDLIGIGVPMKATATATGDFAGGALPGLIAGIIDAPTIKSRIAIAINKARNTDVSKYGKTKTATQAAFQAGRLQDMK